MALSGSSVLLMVQTSAGPPGVYAVVGSQTAVKFDRKVTSQDISDKSSADKAYMAGERTGTVTLDHLYVPNDAGLAALKNAFKSNTLIIVERQESGTVLEYANCLITSISEDAKKASPTTTQVSLEVSGGWVAGAAP